MVLPLPFDRVTAWEGSVIEYPLKYLRMAGLLASPSLIRKEAAEKTLFFVCKVTPPVVMGSPPSAEIWMVPAFPEMMFPKYISRIFVIPIGITTIQEEDAEANTPFSPGIT